LVTKKTILALALITVFCAFALVCTVVAPAFADDVHCDSSDYYGAKKDTFDVDDNVYFNGSGFMPSTTFAIYVVYDKATWNDGDAIPSRVPGTVASVSSDSSGNILPTLIWNKPLTAGKYDIVVDVNGNGKYDASVDCLDDNDVQVTAGFFVIPEIWLGTALGLAGFFAALGMYRLSKRQKH
jgi:hypothetical protein